MKKIFYHLKRWPSLAVEVEKVFLDTYSHAEGMATIYPVGSRISCGYVPTSECFATSIDMDLFVIESIKDLERTLSKAETDKLFAAYDEARGKVLTEQLILDLGGELHD